MFSQQDFLSRPVFCYIRTGLGLVSLILLAPSCFVLWFFIFGRSGFFWDAFTSVWLLFIVATATAEIICAITKRLNELAVIVFFPAIILMVCHVSFFREAAGSSFLYIQLLYFTARIMFVLELCLVVFYWARRKNH